MKTQQQTKCICILTLLCVCLSCNAAPIIDSLDSSVLEKSATLSGCPVPYTPDGYESSVLVYKDSLLIVTNQADGVNCPFLLEVFSLPNMKQTGSYLEFGGGDNQFFFIIPYLSGDKLLLNDVVKKSVTGIDLNAASGLMAEPSSFRQITFTSQKMTWYKDRILLLNPCYFEGNKGQSNNQPRTVATDTSMQWTAPKVPYFATNVTQGSLVVEPHTGKIAFLDGNASLVEFYSQVGTQPVKKVTGPDYSVPEYLIIEAGAESKTVLISKNATSFYVDAVSDNQRIYAAYRSITDGENDYLFCFDWDGNLLKSYKLNGQVKNLSLSADGKAIYVWHNKVDEKKPAESDRLYLYQLIN